jgi:arginyl-tRNA synthetase
MRVFIVEKIEKALGELQADGKLPVFSVPTIQVERPKDEQFGEYTSNVALMISKDAGKNPREIATMFQEKLANDFAKVDVAGPGHLNFFLQDSAFTDCVKEVLEKKNHFGDSTVGQGIKVNNEFISANPTGPLHLGNGRGGFYGDSLSRLLRKTGFAVTNEYYINDAGEQVSKLGHSVLQDDEAVYGGDYILDLKEKIGTLDADAFIVGKKAAELILSDYIQPTIEKGMQIQFDAWTSEYDLAQSGIIARAIEIFKEQGRTFEDEGALFLRTTEFGDDKDRVLIKSDGTKTYFASECGYILSKMEQGFTEIIEIWGADHHGYVSRFEAAARALGFTGKITFLLMQLVKLVKNGEEVRMSKRAGNVVAMDELLELVGHDVTRFFFLQYSPDTHMTFDLGLAEERSQKNPVFYVQYAHARMASILEKGTVESVSYHEADLSLLTHDKEKSLMREMIMFQEFLELASRDAAPHRLPQLAIRLADKFHSYYAECQVIDTENEELSKARLSLVCATKEMLKETLRLIGVSAPEKM